MAPTSPSVRGLAALALAGAALHLAGCGDDDSEPASADPGLATDCPTELDEVLMLDGDPSTGVTVVGDAVVSVGCEGVVVGTGKHPELLPDHVSHLGAIGEIDGDVLVKTGDGGTTAGVGEPYGVVRLTLGGDEVWRADATDAPGLVFP